MQPGRNGRQRLGSGGGSTGADPDEAAFELAEGALGYVEFMLMLGGVILESPAVAALGVTTYVLGKLVPGLPPATLDPLDWTLWLTETGIAVAKKKHHNLQQDPARTDYTVIEIPQPGPGITVTTANGITAERAAVLTSLSTHAAQMRAILLAADITNDRLAGARQAGDQTWERRQLLALLELEREAGLSMISIADDFDALAARNDQEGIDDVTLQASDISGAQQALSTSGFSATFVSFAHDHGFDDTALAALRAELLAAAPDSIAGSVRSGMTQVSDALRTHGKSWSVLPKSDLSTLSQQALRK